MGLKLRRILLLSSFRHIALLVITIITLTVGISGESFAVSYVDDADCMAAYLLDVSEDPQTDSSGQGNTGAVSGATFNATGKFGGAYTFDAADEKIEASDSADFDFADDFALVAWADPDVTKADRRILQRYDGGSKDGYFLAQDDQGVNGEWRFIIFVNPANVELLSDAAPSGAYEHIAGVRASGGGATLYVDGVAQADTETLDGAIDSNGDFNIGISYTDGNEWVGDLDEVAAFRRSLNSTEVNDIMDNGLAPAAAQVADGEFFWIF